MDIVTIITIKRGDYSVACRKLSSDYLTLLKIPMEDMNTEFLDLLNFYLIKVI